MLLKVERTILPKIALTQGEVDRTFLPMVESQTNEKFSQRLNAKMTDKGVSITELAAALGVTYEMARRYVLGSARPRQGKIEKIAELLGVTAPWLMFGDSAVDEHPAKTTPRSEPGWELREPSIPYGARADRRHQGRRVDDPEPSNIAEGPAIRGTVPLISWVQAGEFCEAVDLHQPGYADEWVVATTPIGPHTYALRVQGDSMTPLFPEGTVIVVEPDREAVHGSYVIAKDGTDCTFKQFVRDGGEWYLRPLNPQYQVKPFREGMSICGVIISSHQIFL